MGKTVPLDGTLMRESALGGNSLENLGSKANDIMIFKIAGRCIGCILGSYPGDGWVRLPLPLPEFHGTTRLRR